MHSSFFVISENKHVQFIQIAFGLERENQCSRAYNIILLSKKIQT